MPEAGRATVSALRSADRIVSARGLEVDFRLKGRTVSAIERLDLEIERGEFLVIVGPSGCGKTTLLRVLAGLERPTGGSVELWPRDDERKRRVTGKPISAMVFQEHGVMPWLTVVDNIAFGLRAGGMARAQARSVATDWARRVGLGEFLQAHPHQLSGGMRQRVSIARAFAVDPEILLMDEPFAALDEQTKLGLQEQLVEIWSETQKTVVYVTHSLDEAIGLGDRILVMTGRPGRVRDVIKLDEIIPQPRHVATVRQHPRYGEVFARLWASLGDRTAEGAAR